MDALEASQLAETLMAGFNAVRGKDEQLAMALRAMADKAAEIAGIAQQQSEE